MITSNKRVISKWTTLLIFTLLLGTCNNNRYTKIPLKDMKPELRAKGSEIAKDIIKSFKNKKEASYLLNKEYTTPLVHGRIMKNGKLYRDSYFMINMTLGHIKTFQLFQVIDKGVIKTLRYKLNCDNPDLEFVELKLDINNGNKLADFYLYISTKDEKLERVNMLPVAVK